MFCLVQGSSSSSSSSSSSPPPPPPPPPPPNLIALVLHSNCSLFLFNSASSSLGPSLARLISSVNILRRWQGGGRGGRRARHGGKNKLKMPPGYALRNRGRTFIIHCLSSALSWVGNAPEFGGKIVVLLLASLLGDFDERFWLTCDAWGLLDRDALCWACVSSS